MKFERTAVWGFENAVHGMRNALASWDKSDSDVAFHINENFSSDDPMAEKYREWNDKYGLNFKFGKNDLNLAQRLIKAGSPDRKFMRQIFVSVDITAPMYLFSEFDTYKIGTVANSTSKMHKLASTPITLECFETDDLNDGNLQIGNYNCLKFMYNQIIDDCELLRQKYIETKDKRYWKELIRWLPESWLQMRTVTMNYENIYSMIRQRRHHKLNEWSGKDDSSKPNFISWAKTLPYADELLFYNIDKKDIK